MLITDFPPSSNLQHADVTLLFHELGHAIHDLAGRSVYSRHHSAETARDFNEALSEMLENWCWDARALGGLAGLQPVTGERLSDELVKGLVESRNVLPAVKVLAQLRMTMFDNAVHGAGGGGDIEALYKQFSELGGLDVEGDEYVFLPSSSPPAQPAPFSCMHSSRFLPR